MNIKGLAPTAITMTPQSQVQTERQIKSDGSHDRDPNGQYFYQKKKNKNKMTDEQFDKALEILNKKKFMLDMGWTAKKTVVDEIKFAEITDSLNQVIRTISEFDMWEMFSEESPAENGKGQLLKRTA